MVATMSVVPVLTAVKTGTFPVPLAARPMAGLEFAQVNVEPGTELMNVVAVVFEPLQTVWLAGWVGTGVGLTVIVAAEELALTHTPL